MCNPHERIIGIEETCLGETDITKPAFVRKFEGLLSELGSSVLIFSMDAELKTDMTNTPTYFRHG